MNLDHTYGSSRTVASIDSSDSGFDRCPACDRIVQSEDGIHACWFFYE